MSDFAYEIKKTIAVIGTGSSWNLELNLISWGGRPAVYDLRKWNADHTKMGKGVTLTDAELSQLAFVLAKMEEA